MNSIDLFNQDILNHSGGECFDKRKAKNELEQEEIAIEFNPEELEAVKEEQEQKKEQPFNKKEKK